MKGMAKMTGKDPLRYSGPQFSVLFLPAKYSEEESLLLSQDPH